MPYLPDSNILLRSIDTAHSQYPVATRAISTLLAQGESFFLLPQNLYEFWNVCTRPTLHNGLGLTIADTEAEVLRLEAMFPVLYDNQNIYTEWRRLVRTNSVIGVSVHDARLVAAMQVHGLTHILTFNVRDFVRYSGITAVHPASV